MPRKKSNYKNKSKASMPLSSSQVKAVQKIATKSIMKKAETKMFPSEVVDEGIASGTDASVVFSDIDAVVQGTDNENRIGDSIVPRGLQYKYFLSANTSMQSPAYARVIMIEAKNAEFAATTSNLLLDTSNEPLAPTAGDRTDIIRSLNRKEFRVLYDKVHSLQPFTSSTTNALGTGVPTLYRQGFIKLSGVRKWATDTGNEAENRNIRCYVIVRDAYNNPGTDAANLRFELFTRYYYKDF